MMSRSSSWVTLAGLLLIVGATLVRADSREQIEGKSGLALGELRSLAPELQNLLHSARGVLVFPDIVRMGFGTGGQYGEGALLVNGEVVAYYATSGPRPEFPEAAARTGQVILFMTDAALVSFRNTVGWQIGVHGKVNLLGTEDAARARDPTQQPVLALGFSDQGPVEGLNFDGNTINRIAR